MTGRNPAKSGPASGGSAAHWYGAVFSRIGGYLPVETILEIAPGYGRWTRYLLGNCERLIGIDLSEECVAASKARFANYPQASFLKNDGMSLSAIENNSVDFVFSFDSMVHVDEHILAGYLQQIALKFTPAGVGFIHHSNFAAVPPGTLNPHRREINMSAEKFAALCAEAGLQCISQETVNWGQPELIDCLSVFTTASSERPAQILRYENSQFMAEADRIRELAPLYHPNVFGPPAA